MGRGGQPAFPDDQGPLETSIQHALAKAICDGCMNKIFMKNQAIDLDQFEVKNALLHESGIYDRTHRHSKYKKKKFLEWVSLHHPSKQETSSNKQTKAQHGSAKPEQEAYPDDQGEFQTCTRHALGKAICDGYEFMWFDKPEKVDFLQKEIINTLVAVDGDEKKYDGKWPTDYNGLRMELLEDNFIYSGKAWSIKLKVKEVEKKELLEGFKKRMEIQQSLCESGSYVLVHKLYDRNGQEDGLHCVYLKDLIKHPDTEDDFNFGLCINSWRNKGRQLIELDEEGNRFYKIFCTTERKHQEPRNILEPSFFENNSSYIFSDISTSLTWKISIQVFDVEKDIMIEDMMGANQRFTYLMVYNPSSTVSKSSHCVYVRSIILIGEERCALCLNSHKADPFITLPLDKQNFNRNYIFYRVSCMVNPAEPTASKNGVTPSPSVSTSTNEQHSSKKFKKHKK